MEGLEISVVKLSEVLEENDLFRFDAEFFNKTASQIISKIKSSKFYRIEDGFDVSKLAGFEFTEYFTPTNMNSQNYYIALTSKNIQRNVLNLSEYITIDKIIADSFLTRSKILNNDVVFSYTGEYRRALVMQEIQQFQLGPNICRIRPINKLINPYFLSVFLNSKIGQIILDKEKTLSAQPTVAMSRIRKIPLPIFPDTFQSQIESIVKSAHAKLEESKSLYSQAEDLLLGELGLKDWRPKNTFHTTKKFSDFAQSGRLDAEYYQPKYDDLFERLSCLNCKRLGKIVSIKKSFDPGSDAYQETGIPFIRVSDISKDGIEKTELHLSPIDFDIPELKPKKDTILFSKDGSIGIAYKVQSDLNVFTSGALLHLVTTDSSILPDYLTLVLNSVVVKLQAERDSNGAIIQHWKPSDIENVIIPILPEQIQTKIASLIQQSFECKAQSKQLLEDAKRMVEEEIEKN